VEADSASGVAAIASAATPAIATFVPEFNIRSLSRNRSLERTGHVQTIANHAMTRM
jgi:hypothetical protein